MMSAKPSNGLIAALLFVTACVVAVIFLTFERPPVVSTQNGYRGLGMEQVVNPRVQSLVVARNVLPAAYDPADTDGPTAGETYENVFVLRDLSLAQFGRLMQAMTDWVSPEQGCNYCHNPDNLAAEEPYTKIVSRRMLQMTRQINTQWAAHFASGAEGAGVTCYTCHRGQPVPAETWTSQPPVPRSGLQADWGQNHPSPVANLSSMHLEPFSAYLLQSDQIRVVSTAPRPGTNTTSLARTEQTYSLMMHLSQALGVNCTYCHNSRSFFAWDSSPPARLPAWYGIQMVRDINTNFMVPLTPLFAANPLGQPDQGPRTPRVGVAQHDVLKVNCATCHQGINRPFNGAPHLQNYPELGRVSAEEIRQTAARQ
jgi:photosynthetic reaction center cytochrome c subunit